MPPQRHLPKSAEPRVRQRSSKACGPCRKRKIKCDGTLPCPACAGYGYECIYTEVERMPRKTVSTTAIESPAQPSVTYEEPLPQAASDKVDKADGPYMTSESLPRDHNGTPFLDGLLTTKFTSSHSAIAFPRSLGISLGLPDPPRLQSFGWNPGTRPEPFAAPMQTLRDILNLEQVKLYSEIYFNEVHPFFGLLNRDLYFKYATEFWGARKQGTDFEACMCGIVALGSMFSGTVAPVLATEALVVEHGRLLLDLTTTYAPASLSRRHIAAWILRALYLRSTTRPHLSWMASCTAVHIAEAIGLHREVNVNQTRVVLENEKDCRRRIFWVAVALNQFLSSEYGRTRVTIDNVAVMPLLPGDGEFTAHLVKIMQSTPEQQTGFGTLQLIEKFKIAAEFDVKAPFLALLKADVCFCIYRTLRSCSSTNTNLAAPQVTSLLEVIQVASDSVKFLTAMHHPWFNIVSTCFQSVCVLLSLCTPDSFAMIPNALETLKIVATAHNSPLSQEALRTAHALVQGARDKRRKELESLDQGLAVVSDFSQLGSASPFDMGIEWLTENDTAFGDFLYLSQFDGLEAQF